MAATVSCFVAENKSILMLDDIEIHLTRKRVKNVNIRVKPPAGRVQVSAPHHLGEARLRRVLQQRLPWIKAKRAEIQSRPAPVPAAALVDGAEVPFLDEQYRLRIETTTGRALVYLQATNPIVMKLPPDAGPAVKQQLLDEWYRHQLKLRVPVLLDRWQQRIGVSVTSWRIRKMRSRWGSCNVTARRISLNLELARAPLACLEMVLVHELVHLLEAGHNKRFYGFMDQFLPDWRAADELLKQMVLTPYTID